MANENVYTCRQANPNQLPKHGNCGAGDSPSYHTDYDTGWEKHTFKELLNSDRARFQIACGTTPVYDSG